MPLTKRTGLLTTCKLHSSFNEAVRHFEQLRKCLLHQCVLSEDELKQCHTPGQYAYLIAMAAKGERGQPTCVGSYNPPVLPGIYGDHAQHDTCTGNTRIAIKRSRFGWDLDFVRAYHWQRTPRDFQIANTFDLVARSAGEDENELIELDCHEHFEAPADWLDFKGSTHEFLEGEPEAHEPQTPRGWNSLGELDSHPNPETCVVE